MLANQGQTRRQRQPEPADAASSIYHLPSSPSASFVITTQALNTSHLPLPTHSHLRSQSQPHLSQNLIASSPHFISPSAPSAYYSSYASPATPYLSQIDTTNLPATAPPQSMHNIFDFATNQQLYQHQDFPASSGYLVSPVEAVAYPQQYWFQGQGNMATTSSPAMANSSLQRGVKRPHNRTLSATSSVASNRSRSPYGASAPTFHQESSGLAKSSGQGGLDSHGRYQHNLPTPTQTPTQDSFIASQYQSQSQQHDQATMASAAMARAFEQQSVVDDETPGMSHSGRHSVSSYGPEPSTPHGVTDSYDDGFKVPAHDIVPRIQVPKFDRTMSDIYQDECYNPAPVVAPRSAGPKSAQSQQFLSPFRNEKVNQALQAAQLARSQSPSSQVYSHRGISPFRPDSPWVKTIPRGGNSQHNGQQTQSSAQAGVSAIALPRQDSVKTMSPKEALLDYRDDDDSQSSISLFPDTASTNFDNSVQYLVPTSTASRNGWNAQYAAQTASQPFSMAVPSQTYNVLPFSTQQYRTAKSEDTPSFPAQLISMESSCSEAPASSQSSAVQLLAKVNSNQSTKPESSAAASGTYTCTYNNCVQRFDTAQRLQKHKREQHKQPSTSSGAAQPEPVLVAHPSQIPKPDYTPGVGSGMTSADLLARNSQTGPHKCDRLNPTTGKPCNSVFSRPYDLTRHEDTIHNVKKQKVRCALCVEEKTFSRNDALTRHMRVVHPEVDFPGKHRKKSDARAY